MISFLIQRITEPRFQSSCGKIIIFEVDQLELLSFKSFGVSFYLCGVVVVCLYILDAFKRNMIAIFMFPFDDYLVSI